MNSLILPPALLAMAMLGGLILALFGAGVWDLVAYVLIAPTIALVGLVVMRAGRALTKPDDVPPAEASPSLTED
jgi:predicted lipid-binding transport protein (Tim44 family)